MEVINQIVIICSYIITIGGAIGVICSAYQKAKKPKDDIEERLSINEKDIEEMKRKLDNDYTSIQDIQNDMNLLMRSVFSLIESKITGNNIEGLKKTRDELIHALTEK